MNNKKEEKIIIYYLNFIDSFPFISISLEKLTENPSDNIHKKNCLNCNCLISYVKTKGESLIHFCLKNQKYMNFEINNKLKISTFKFVTVV